MPAIEADNQRRVQGADRSDQPRHLQERPRAQEQDQASDHHHQQPGRYDLDQVAGERRTDEPAEHQRDHRREIATSANSSSMIERREFITQQAFYWLADEQRETILVACSKCAIAGLRFRVTTSSPLMVRTTRCPTYSTISPHRIAVGSALIGIAAACTTSSRSRAHASSFEWHGRDGGVREELAEGITAAPAHEWFQVKGLIAARPTTHVRYRGHTGKHMLVLSFTGFDPERTLAELNSRTAASP
jgi:hypothetical protein